MATPRRRTWSVAAATVALGAGCGQASARIVQLPDSPISFQVPVSFAELTQSGDPGAVYGRPGSSAGEVGDQPVLFIAAAANGDLASYKALRSLATNGQYDPLDSSLSSLPDGAQLIDYKEINAGRVWGIRLKLAVSGAAKDFQALIDRTSNSLVVTEVTCTQSCFNQQATLIEHIQGSWSLES